MTIDPRLEELLDTVVSQGGSDLHIFPGGATIRVSGSLVAIPKFATLTGDDTRAMLQSIVPEQRASVFDEEQAVDFAYRHKGTARFRVNAYQTQGAVALALRLIPNTVRTFAELQLPSALELFTEREQGFFLVVGPVGQGKSTTLASMIEHINKTRTEHILTIEDPVEYVFTQDRSLIHQREVFVDTPAFHVALQNAFREDVDIIMVGEMRDYDTISAAVSAAETGHLVYSTLHTNDAAQTINRIVDMFPAPQQAQVRVQLAGSLAGIFSQRLVPRISGGLVPAYELLINNKAVSSLIREGRTHEIRSIIQTSAQDGMIDMDRSLADLVRRGEITVEHATEHASDPNTFESYL